MVVLCSLAVSGTMGMRDSGSPLVLETRAKNTCGGCHPYAPPAAKSTEYLKKPAIRQMDATPTGHQVPKTSLPVPRSAEAHAMPSMTENVTAMDSIWNGKSTVAWASITGMATSHPLM